MSQEENANAWKKKEAQESLRDDRKSRFVLHQEAVNAKRRDTTAHDAHVQSCEDAHARWTGQSAAPQTPGGNAADAELAQLRKKVYAERIAPAALPLSVSVESVVETIAALIRDWMANTENGKNYGALFEQNEWNKAQMNEMTQHLIKEGHPINAQLPEVVFLRCYRGGHLDPRKRRDRAGNVIYLRGEARRPAPVPVPHCVWPDEAAAIERERQENAVAAAATETARARSLPFDQLQREAARGRKPASPLMGPMVS